MLSAPVPDSGSAARDERQWRDAQIAGRLRDVEERIRQASRRAGRSRAAVTLVAVSKGVAVDDLRAARRAGQVDFGESRAQALVRKAQGIGPGVRWHFVGQLQRNKVKDVVGRVTLAHSIDRLPLAQQLGQRAQTVGRLQRVLVQVDLATTRVAGRGGCPLDEAPQLVARIRDLEGVACEGLMTVPPRDADARSCFATLRALRDDLRARFPEVQHLSMGMSNDFELAIEEGATIVRLGTAVFGPRRSA